MACLVNYFSTSEEYLETDTLTGVKKGDLLLSWESIFEDIRSAVDWVHMKVGGEIIKSQDTVAFIIYIYIINVGWRVLCKFFGIVGGHFVMSGLEHLWIFFLKLFAGSWTAVVLHPPGFSGV